MGIAEQTDRVGDSTQRHWAGLLARNKTFPEAHAGLVGTETKIAPPNLIKQMSTQNG